MKRFKSFNEAVKVDDISVGVKKKKPAGVKADEPLKGYAYNEKMKFKFKGKKTALHIKNNQFLESSEEITEAKADLVKTIEAEIKKYGPKDIDTPTYKQAITLVKKGDMKALKKLIYTSDTEPSEFLSYALAQHDPAAFKKMYPRAKAGDYLRSIVIQHGESVEINEDEQEEKYYIVRVQGKGAPGRDYINVKTRAHSQKAALEKIRNQYPGRVSYRIVKEDFKTQISLAIEEVELDEALSPKEKEKRLQMIKKAVEKLNRANIEKVKKMAMRDMKAAGMFDDVIDENQYIGGYRDSSRDGLGPKAKANAPKLSRIEQLQKQLEQARKQREVHDEAYRKYMKQASEIRDRNPDDLGGIHGAERRADEQEEMAQKQNMKIQDIKDDIATIKDQMK